MEIERKLYKKLWSEALKGSETIEVVYPTGTLRIDDAYKLIGKGKRFLDVGCGAGTLSLLVKDRFKELYGVDISPEAVKMANKVGIKAAVANLNTEKIPFEDGFFDTVACLAIIEHVFEPDFLVSELSRVTKKGGFLILDTPNIRYINHQLSVILKGEFPKTSGDLDFSYDGGHIHYFTYKDIRKLLEKNGFKVEKEVASHFPETKKKLPYRLLKLLGPKFEREFLGIEILVVAKKVK